MCTKKIVIALSLLIFAQQSLTSSQEKHCGIDRHNLKILSMSIGGTSIITGGGILIPYAFIAPYLSVDPTLYYLGGTLGVSVGTFYCYLPYLLNRINKKKINDLEMGHITPDNSSESISEQLSPIQKKKRINSVQNIENVIRLNSNFQKVELNDDLDNTNLITDPDLYPTGTDYGRRLRSSGQNIVDSIESLIVRGSHSLRNLLNPVPVEIIDNQKSYSTSSSEINI